MLTEFAFTPSIFDEDAHDDKEAWRDQLKDLGRNMFPRVSAWPVVVSDLYAGSWNQVILKLVKTMRDDKARVICEGILKNIQKVLVSRPQCRDWPDEDIAWAREAVASNAIESIERIVSNNSTKCALHDEYKMIRSLDEVEGGSFWRDITSDAHPLMIIDDQIKLLRKLCMHSEWVALINPYTSGNEIDFALELLRTAKNRSAGFTSIKFELHTQEPKGNIDATVRQETLRKVTHFVSEKVCKILEASESVALFFWPEFKERRPVAGTYTTDSDGNKQKRPRWGVSMNHVARGRYPDSDPTHWNLLREEELGVWFRKYVIEDALQKPVPAMIRLSL